MNYQLGLSSLFFFFLIKHSFVGVKRGCFILSGRGRQGKCLRISGYVILISLFWTNSCTEPKQSS